MEKNSKSIKRKLLDLKKHVGLKTDKTEIEKIAKESGFWKRKPRKIKPLEFLMGFFMMRLNNGYSFSSWAEMIGMLNDKVISKQAVNKKIKKELIIFLKMLLEKKIGSSVNVELENTEKKIFKKFKRVLVNDSTTIKLNDKLAKFFPGNKTGDKKKKYALLKIQTVYDIISENFSKFEITNYRKNDQSASGDILDIAETGDLIIRDLGYFATKVFKEIGAKNIFFFKSYEVWGKSI